MTHKVNELLTSLALENLQRCALKLSAVSSGKWSITGSNLQLGTLDEEMKHCCMESDVEKAAIYVDIKGDTPFAAFILLRSEDMDRVSKSLFRNVLTSAPGPVGMSDLILCELGNILLNSLASALANFFNCIFLPSPPRCLKGAPEFLLEAMDMTLNVRDKFRILTINLEIKCEGELINGELMAFIPDSLAERISETTKKDKE